MTKDMRGLSGFLESMGRIERFGREANTVDWLTGQQSAYDTFKAGQLRSGIHGVATAVLPKLIEVSERMGLTQPRGLAAGAPSALAHAGMYGAYSGMKGATDSYFTPTEVFAQRNSLPMPTTTLGEVGLRTLGTLQNVGNQASFGLIGRKLWPQVEGDVSNDPALNGEKLSKPVRQRSGGAGATGEW